MRVLHENASEAEVVQPVRTAMEDTGGVIKNAVPVTVTVNRISEVDVKSEVEKHLINERVRSGKSLLGTPPPYRKEWLDERNLKVVYKNGKSVLRFK